MAAGDLLIQCTDPVTNKLVVFHREQRSRMRYSSTVPGGDAACSWTVSCDDIIRTGFPGVRSRVKVYDPVRETYPWVGILEKPVLHWERGKLVSVDFNAVGAAQAEHRQFPGRLVFIDADHPSPLSINYTEVITDLKDAMLFGLSITPLVSGVQTGVATSGITLGAPTEDFRGHTGQQLWTAICTLTARLATPYIWMVYADQFGLPALHWLAAPSSPEYFEMGNAKTIDLGIDMAEVANLIYVVFAGDETLSWPDQSTPEPGEIDYSATPDLQTHFVNVSEEIVSLSDAQGFVQGLYAKFNQRLPSEGSIVLDRDIRTRYAGEATPHIDPITEVRAGKPIRLGISHSPYVDAQIDMLIMSAEYDEDSCQTTLSPSTLSQQGRDMRFLQMLAGRNKFNWSLVSPQLTVPNTIQKTEVLQPAYKGWNPTDPQTPHPAVFPSGVTIGSGTISGSSVPVPNREHPTEEETPIIVRPALIPIARTVLGHREYGTLGGMIIPQVLPPERVNYPAMFSTTDEDGELLDGERAGQDIQEVYIDTITVKTLPQGTIGSVTIQVDVYNYDEDETTANVFEIELDTADHARKLLDASTAPLQPVGLKHGDHLIWRVVDPSADFVVKVCLSGWKHWSEFPVLVGPPYIPGNE